MPKYLVFVIIFASHLASAQKEDSPYKIDKDQWAEMTYGFKVTDIFKNKDLRYVIDIRKVVLGGGIITKRTVYSNSNCSCVLLVINFKKGAPVELVDYTFKFKKYYSRDVQKWRYDRSEDRVGYTRCL